MKGLYGQFACAMPRDSRMVAAGPLGRLVYFEAALYCRENLTDGVIARAQLSFWTPDVTRQRKVKLLDQLATLGALHFCSEGWQIPMDVWREWNPLKSEVEEKRRQEAKKKADYRAKRQGVSDECPDGTNAGQPAVSEACPDPVPDSHRQSQSHKPKTETYSPSTSLHPARSEPREIEATVTQLAERFRA